MHSYDEQVCYLANYDDALYMMMCESNNDYDVHSVSGECQVM